MSDMESFECSSNRDTLEQLVGYMIQKSIESGIMSKDEMVIMLEDMIHSIERGSLAVALENV